MTAKKTLAELRVITRELADLENQQGTAASPGWADDPELDRRINEGLKRLRSLLITSNMADVFVKEDKSITTASGTAEYQLPADFQFMLAVVASDGSNHRVLDRWSDQELGEMLELESSGLSAGRAWDMFYMLKPEGIEFRPKPSGAYVITLRYIPVFRELTEDEHTFDGVAGWELFACLSAAIAFKTKGDEDASLLIFQKKEITDEIQFLAANRDMGRAHKMMDQQRDHARDGMGYLFDDWNN